MEPSAPPSRRPGAATAGLQGFGVVVRDATAAAVRRGHPWVYRDGVSHLARDLRAGDAVTLGDATGAPLGIGVVDPDSPIAVRVWSLDPRATLAELFGARLERALARRDALFDERTTAYRLVHGEGDRMPGIVVDRYGDVAVVRADGEAAAAVLERNGRALSAALVGRGLPRIVVKSRGAEAAMWEGGAAPADVRVLEHGVPFFVDVARGQKTGAFLDQRENRRRVGEWVRARGAATVLNLFSYAGGFSQRAALAGARVTSVDVAAQAHATAQRSFKEAGLDPRGHEFVAADAFAFLDDAARAGRRWDVVISDPPSFAPSEKVVPRALASYRRLHRAAAGVVAPGGMLCAASCSSHVPMEAFAATLDDASIGRSDLSLVAAYGAPEDHPTLAGWPEGRYLKLCVLT